MLRLMLRSLQLKLSGSMLSLLRSVKGEIPRALILTRELARLFLIKLKMFMRGT